MSLRLLNLNLKPSWHLLFQPAMCLMASAIIAFVVCPAIKALSLIAIACN